MECLNEFFKKDETICYLHEIHFNLKGTHRLKVKDGKKGFPNKCQSKASRSAILTFKK